MVSGGEKVVSIVRGLGHRWMAWEKLCIPKKWGGLGFRRLKDFNMAMLTKQAWRLIKHPSSLAAKIMKAKYYPHSHFVDASRGGNPSFVWSSLLETKNTIQQNTRWRIGNGHSVRIWHDKWLPDAVNPLVTSPAFPYLQNAKVNSLFNSQGTGWDEEMVKEIFNSRDAQLILNTPIPLGNREDMVIWDKDAKGVFSVRSCYNSIMRNLSNVAIPDWSKVWNLHLPPRTKTFIWQVCTGCLPTADLLRQRRVECDSQCPLCLDEDESAFHLLAHCRVASQCWNLFGQLPDKNQVQNCPEWFSIIFNTMQLPQIRLFVII